MLHAVTMSLVGLKVAFMENWSLADIVAGRNELVSAFLALELAYLFQAGPCNPVNIAPERSAQICMAQKILA